VAAGLTETVDIAASQASLTGQISFTGSASLADAQSLYVQGNEYSGSGGYARDWVAPSGSGGYELIVTPGDWRPRLVYTRFFDSGSGVPADYRNVTINYYDSVIQGTPLITSATAAAVQDHEIAFGEISITVDAGTGTVSNPRIQSSYCEYRDENNIRLYFYYLNAYSSSQNNVSQATVSATAPEGTCNLQIYGNVGGTDLALGSAQVEIVAGTQQQQDIGGPSLTITYPDPDTVVDANTIDVEGNATDDVAVQFVTVNGAAAILTPESPGDFSTIDFEAVGISIPNKGPNELATVAVDTSGKETRDTRTLSWTPADGNVVNTLSVDVTGTASDDAGIDSITVNGQTAAVTPQGGTSVTFERQGLTLIEGSNSLEVIVTDISQLSTSQTHSVSVVLNSAPTANDGSATTDEDTSAGITLTGGDIDGDSLTYSVVANPTNGTVSCTAASCTYTPNADYNGSDSFTFKTNDGALDSNVATISITVNAVNDDPDAVDDSASTNEDTPVSTSVLVNDTDIDGDSLTVSGSTNGSDGTVSCTTSCTYTPNLNFNGTDSYTYTISDGNGGGDTATVSVTIIAVNDAPEANDDVASTNEDTPVSTGVLANDSDVDGDSLTVAGSTNGSDGTVSCTAASCTYTPNLNFNGSDSYTYTVSDGNGGSDTATVDVTIIAVNDAPLADAGGPYSGSEGSAIGPNGGGSSDVDGDSLAYAWSVDSTSCSFDDPTSVTPQLTCTDNGNFTVSLTVTDPSGASDTDTAGVSVVNVAPTIGVDNASITVNESATAGNTGSFADVGDDDVVISASVGSVTQTDQKDGNWTWSFVSTDGPDETQTVTITATDADGASTSTTFALTVLNVPPVAGDDSGTTAEDTAVTTSVLANDTDVGFDALSVTGSSNGSNGTVSCDATSCTYAPSANFNGTDSYTYTVSDEDGAEDTGEVVITVTPVNDVPSVSANDDTAQYSDPVLVTISAGDIDSTSLSIMTTALPAGLSLSGPTCTDNAAAPPSGVDCTWTVGGNVTAAPGDYSVTATVTDNGELSDTTLLSASTPFVITVEQEDVRSTYTGPLFLSSAESGDFTVTLMATIRDITVVGGDPATDPDAGVITNASVSFYESSDPNPANWVLLCNAPAVTLVFAGNEQVGFAGCDYSSSLANNEDELPVEVSIVVNDHYVDTTDNEFVVLVVRPGEGKITGGGQLELDNSAGVYTADPEQRTNYGFNAMAQKKGKKNTQLKGRMTIILRATDGNKYKIKSNALLSLGVDLDPDGDGNSEDEPFYAEFEAKANLTDVTDPLNPISLGGNLLLQMRMTDNGEPGDTDTISLTLWDGGTLLFSSNWDGSQSVEQLVERGNLQVHP
jgi:hypothetical protein